MATIQFSGLASGIDTQAIVDAILDVESRPLERLQERRALFSQRKNAFDELRGKLSAFETALRSLSSPSTFRGRTATSSDEGVLRATAGSGAETGIFQIEVNALAAADKFKSDGYAGPDQGLVADGQITLQSGSEEAIVIDVSAATGNNSLEAIRDAINDADAGVQAAIIFDGADYRLTVRSAESGTANALTITDGTDLNLDAPGNRVSTAADASITIDGIDVTSSSNKITGVIENVTLDLRSVSAGAPVSVELAQDTDATVEAVQEVVSQYNDLFEYFKSQFSNENPGPLDGDFTALAIQRNVQSLFTGGVDGIPFGDIRSLSAIGVSFDGKDGTAALDTGKLRELLDSNFADVGNLFLSSGRATSSRVSFVSAGGATEAGTYAVTVTQAAEQASVSGSRNITSLNSDEVLTIETAGTVSTVNLTSGQDVDEIVDTINAQLRADGVDATALSDNGVLKISTAGYGASAEITVTSDRNDPGNGKSSGFDTTPVSDTGVDVAGTINGVAAEGQGQLLIGADGDAADDLRLKITASATDIANNGGDFGTLSYSRGFIDTLLARVEDFTQFDSGSLDVAKGAIDANLKSLESDIDRVTERLALREQQLLRSFAEAERAISTLNAQQSALGGFTVL